MMNKMISKMMLLAVALSVFALTGVAQNLTLPQRPVTLSVNVENLGGCTGGGEVDCLKVNWKVPQAQISNIRSFVVEAKSGTGDTDSVRVNAGARTATVKLFHQVTSFTVTVKGFDAQGRLIARGTATGNL